MPGRDGTGPMGQGTMSGRGLGYCTGIGYGFGCGMGRRMGRGSFLQITGTYKCNLLLSS